MARIRSIKPEFWTSEQVLECSPITRLMFVGMWNFADDMGRLPCSPKSIKAQVFPSDDISLDAIRGMINELSSNGLLLIYSIEDKDYLQITGWSHQRIDKPQPAKYPAPFFDDSKNAPRTLPPDTIGEDRKGKDIPAVKTARDESFDEFWKSYPRRDGANPKDPAAKLFAAAVKGGEPAENIIRGAKACAAAESKNVGTPYIPQAVKWLRDKRWRDYQIVTEPEASVDWDAVCLSFKSFGRWSKWGGPEPGAPGCRCPSEILAKHGIPTLGPDRTTELASAIQRGFSPSTQ